MAPIASVSVPMTATLSSNFRIRVRSFSSTFGRAPPRRSARMDSSTLHRIPLFSNHKSEAPGPAVTFASVGRLKGMFLFTKPSTMVTAAEALPGRDEPFPVPARHEVLDTPLAPPFPDGLERAVVGMGCFWGAERVFWQAPGVYTTAVGYAGGFTKN